MPVLFNGAECQGKLRANTADVESLVSGVKDRLCIKARDRHFSGNRSSPYQRSNTCRYSLCHCDTKHNSSPASVGLDLDLCQKRKKCHRQSERCLSCTRGQKMPTQHSSSSTRNVEEARTMLEKLLAEQSLIQEAVRRLQTRKLNCLQPVLSFGSSQKTSFPFSNIDNVDPTVQSYSESEDDSLSQHSLDL